jgi:hypothetical protein
VATAPRKHADAVAISSSIAGEGGCRIMILITYIVEVFICMVLYSRRFGLWTHNGTMASRFHRFHPSILNTYHTYHTYPSPKIDSLFFFEKKFKRLENLGLLRNGENLWRSRAGIKTI